MIKTIEGLNIKIRKSVLYSFIRKLVRDLRTQHNLFDEFMDVMKRSQKMPKREDIKKVLVIGSGPIVIGQAAEFDYAGTQACRALQEEGLKLF